MSAAAALASLRTQASTAPDSTDAQPFGAFLDADETQTPATAQSAGPMLPPAQHGVAGAGATQANKTAIAGEVAPKAKPTNGVRWTKGRGASTAAENSPDHENGQATASASPADSAQAGSNADAPANTDAAVATQPATAGAANAAVAAMGSAAAATANAVALAGTNDAASPPNSKDGTEKDGGAASAGQTAPQALAAAFVLNSEAGAAAAFGRRASDAGDAGSATVGKLNGLSSSASNAGSIDGKGTATTKSTAAATPPDSQAGASDGSDAGSAGSGTNTDASPSDNAQQPAQIQSAENASTALSGMIAAGVVGAGGASTGNGAHATQFGSLLTAANAAGGTGPTTSAAASALANFGIAAGNAAGPSTSTGAADGGVAVPLSGVAIAIAARAQAGSNRFDIRLDPPELGRIDVRLGVDSKGQVTSHVTVDRADTLQLLQSQQSQLQQALEQAGLKTAQNGLQFTLRDQSFAGQNNSGSGHQQSAAQLVIPDSDVAPVDSAQIYARLRLGGGLDIKV
ncbi:MAG: flagellar hook-length control protein FliK [Xanthobacteraceae bacterium]